jgi:hypothetical protein
MSHPPGKSAPWNHDRSGAPNLSLWIAIVTDALIRQPRGDHYPSAEMRGNLIDHAE